MDTIEQPQELAKRIFKLAGGELRFKYKFNTPEEFLTGGIHNSAEFERLEEMGVSERIWDLICLFLTEVLSPVVLAECGDASADSLRQFLLNNLLKTKYECQRIKQLARATLADKGFTEEQLELINRLIDAWPHLIIEEIVAGVSALCLIPKSESSKITGILVEMFREVGDVDRN